MKKPNKLPRILPLWLIPTNEYAHVYGYSYINPSGDTNQQIDSSNFDESFTHFASDSFHISRAIVKIAIRWKNVAAGKVQKDQMIHHPFRSGLEASG